MGRKELEGNSDHPNTAVLASHGWNAVRLCFFMSWHLKRKCYKNCFYSLVLYIFKSLVNEWPKFLKKEVNLFMNKLSLIISYIRVLFEY